MKAIVLQKNGKPSVLKVKEIPDPHPAENEVLVRLQFSGINYAEILSRKGLYSWAPKKPYVLGMEGAGIIEDVGSKVDKNRIGEKVVVGAQYGCYAQTIAVHHQQALPTLDFYDMKENAAFLVNFMTAWISMFELGKIKSEDIVLISPAAGGVGSAAVLLAAKAGCSVFGLAGSDEKIELIKKLGANDGFNYRNRNWFDEFKNRVGGADLILEMVGGDIYRKCFELLNPYGRMAVAGFASLDLKIWNPLSWWQTWRDIPRVNLMDVAIKSSGVFATHLGYLLKDREKLQQAYQHMIEFINENKIKPVIGKVFPFDKAAEAHAFIESRQSTGKILLQQEV